MTGGLSPAGSARRSRRMLVLGGATYHPGGLEAFCARAAEAVNSAGAGWAAEWVSTDTAYLSGKRLFGVARRLRAVVDASRAGVDLIWLQWSTLADLLFLIEARALGIPVMVTPHLGANARLQRVAMLRATCRTMVRAADRIAPLFDGQHREIALPKGVPSTVIRTFLPPASLNGPLQEKAPGPVRLIHAGRLSEGKGSFRMVELCAILRDRGVSFSARIVGRSDAATMTRLRAAIDAAALGDRIEMIEWLAEEALIRALGEADVLVHLSTLDSFPLIVLEAMAAGAVPIVGEMAGASAMIETYGGHVARHNAALDAADWITAQAISRLRDNGAAIGARVRADHDWRACAAQAIAAGEATLAGRKERAR